MTEISFEERIQRKEEVMRVILKEITVPLEQVEVPQQESVVKPPLPEPKPVAKEKPAEKPVVKESVQMEIPVYEPVNTVAAVEETEVREAAKPVEPQQKPLPPVQKPEEPVRQKASYDYAGYQDRLGGKLENYKKYPYMARRKGMEGVVHIRAVIGADGALVSSFVHQSSGFRLLDDEALTLIKAVFPFENGSGEQFTLIIPIRYRLAE